VTEVLVVMPGYFEAMNIPLINGRVFTKRDRTGVHPAGIVINRTLAHKFFPNEDPIGKPLAVQWSHPDEPYEIIGIVGDVHQKSLDKEANPAVFLSNLQEPTAPVNLVVRTQGDPRQLANAVRAEIRALDREMPIAAVRAMDEIVSDSYAAPRFNTILLGGFAALALVLAGVGIFGVISYSVAQRTQEIGIRRALGAGAGSVMRMVLQQGMGLSAIGVVIGVAGALAATRLLESLLYEVTPTDPETFVAVPVVLMAVSVLACYLPARRAATIDPIRALHYE
jgi:putative ABC transport system permease protein